MRHKTPKLQGLSIRPLRNVAGEAMNRVVRRIAAQSSDPVGTVLLNLYQVSHETPHAQFHDTALGLLKCLIPFDFAKWGSSHLSSQGVIFHEAHLHQEPPEIMEAYTHVYHEDSAARWVARNLGITANFHNPTVFAGERHRAIRDYTRRYRHANALITGRRDPRTGLMHSLSLYRADPERTYTERERRLCQFLVPHCAQALVINRMLQVEQVRRPDSPGTVAMAIADPFGTLHFAEPAFLALVRSEWMGFEGATLPSPLQLDFLGSGPCRFLGRTLLLSWMSCKGLYFLRARQRLPVDSLTPRELAIAREVSAGLTHKEIARKLGIAPATVRNHLNLIHERSHARNNAELAAQLRLAGY